jgi:putative flippase GtrA
MTSVYNTTELFRYIINGIVATATHYITLRFNIEILGFSSAGLSNLFAAMVGISVSFLGNRYFVFALRRDANNMSLFFKFICLYGFIALVHGGTLLLWTDIWKYNYSIGFLIASFFQFSSSYIGNKTLVFKP